MSTAESRAIRAAYMRKWNAKNREKINAQQKHRYATDRKRSDAVRGRARMTNLRERGGADEETEEFVLALLRDPCSYCGESMPMPGKIVPEGASLDHIDPDGDSHWSNLTGSCTRCNGRKARMPLLLALLDQQLRSDFRPVAEQIMIIRGRVGQRLRVEF